MSIKGWCLREKEDFDKHFKVIRANSTIFPVLQQNWIAAAQERFELRTSRKHFGLIDAVLVVKQKEHACKVISGDPHFKGLPGCLFMD